MAFNDKLNIVQGIQIWSKRFKNDLNGCQVSGNSWEAIVGFEWFNNVLKSPHISRHRYRQLQGTRGAWAQRRGNYTASDLGQNRKITLQTILAGPADADAEADVRGNKRGKR